MTEYKGKGAPSKGKGYDYKGKGVDLGDDYYYDDEYYVGESGWNAPRVNKTMCFLTLCHFEQTTKARVKARVKAREKARAKARVKAKAKAKDMSSRRKSQLTIQPKSRVSDAKPRDRGCSETSPADFAW